MRSPKVDRVNDVIYKRPSFDLAGRLRLYLSPKPVREYPPSTSGMPFVYLDDFHSVNAELNGYVFKTFITSAATNTYMTHKLAQKIGLLCKIVLYEKARFDFWDGGKTSMLAMTKEVTLALTSEVKLTTQVWILPEGEDKGVRHDCYVGYQTLADNNILQRFFEGRCLLYQLPKASGREMNCFLRAHCLQELSDPPVSLFVNTGYPDNLICKRGREDFPIRMCVMGVKSLVLSVDQQVSFTQGVLFKSGGPANTHFSLGYKFLRDSAATIDYAKGYLYIKVDRRRYRL